MKPTRKAGRRRPDAAMRLMALAIPIGAILLGALLVIFNWKAMVRSAAEEMFAAERSRYLEKINRLENELAELSAMVRDNTAEPAGLPAENAASATARSRAEAAGGEPGCQDIEAGLRQAIEELAALPSLQKYGLGDGLLPRLEMIRKKLLDHPPIVVRETDSLYSILTNTAHFYRVLGRDDLMLLNDIITGGGEKTEDLLALLYQWSGKYDECGKEDGLLALPLDRLYEYAGFFLNTLGGQAYIFRRDTRTRILARYYCIMIIDRANARVINRHGIDLRPAVDALLQELKVAPRLKYHSMYLENLTAIKARYAAD